METNATWSSRPFHVVGRINIYVGKGTHLKGNYLRKMLLKVHSDNPWIAIRGCGPFHMSTLIDEPKLTKGKSVHLYPFKLPAPTLLNSDQFYAYSKYILNLAESFSLLGLTGIRHVGALLEIESREKIFN